MGDHNLAQLDLRPAWARVALKSSRVFTTESVFNAWGRGCAGEKEPIDRALETMHKVLNMEGRQQGLAPVFVDTKTAKLKGSLITLGARGDSYYEYLLKQWLLSGKKDEAFLRHALLYPPPPHPPLLPYPVAFDVHIPRLRLWAFVACQEGVGSMHEVTALILHGRAAAY